MKKFVKTNAFLCLAFLSLIAIPSQLFAQDQQPMQASQSQQQEIGQQSNIQSIEPKSEPKSDSAETLNVKRFDAESFPSVLFTYWEQVAIEDARRSRGARRAPTDAELERDLRKGSQDEKQKPPPEERNIALSGISYEGQKNWTIWLNGQRVTPRAIPEEALDLKVFKEYIEIKWFDEYTNRIIPIRLRPNQRFNIDSRIFLPG